MLGPLGRPGLSAPRRPRRRTVLVSVLAMLVVALVVGEVAYQVVRSGGSAAQRDALSWDADAAAIAAQSEMLAGEVHALRGDAKAVAGDRLRLEQSLAALEQATAAQQGALATIELPAPALPFAGSLRRALDLRAAGARQLSAGISAAINGGAVASAVAALQAAGADFEQADADYARFARGLPKQVDPAPEAGGGRWIGEPPAWTAAGVTRWANSLAAVPALRARRSLQLLDVSLRPAPVRISGLPASTTTSTTTTTTSTTTSTTTTTVPGATTTSRPGAAKRPSRPATTSSTSTTTTVPPPTTTLQIPPRGSVSVLPPTSSVAVVAVVRNDGNVAAGPVSVAATLTPTGPGAASSGGGRASTRIGALTPGTARYLVLKAIPTRRGRYLLDVTVSAPGAAMRRAEVVLEVGS